MSERVDELRMALGLALARAFELVASRYTSLGGGSPNR
jgi:hypothetical protein